MADTGKEVVIFVFKGGRAVQKSLSASTANWYKLKLVKSPIKMCLMNLWVIPILVQSLIAAHVMMKEMMETPDLINELMNVTKRSLC